MVNDPYAVKGRKSRLVGSSYHADGVLSLHTEPVALDDTEWTFRPSPHQLNDGFEYIFLAQATWLLLKGLFLVHMAVSFLPNF